MPSSWRFTYFLFLYPVRRGCSSIPLEWRVACAGLLVFLNVGYGQYRTTEVTFRKGPRVVIIQTNVVQEMKNDDRHSSEVFRDVWDLARPASEIDADLVVWPETSYPYMYGSHEKGMSKMEIARKYVERSAVPGKPYRETPTEEMGDILHLNFKDGDEHTEAMARMLSKPMLLGTSFWDIRLSGATYTNASILIVPGPGRVGSYHKIHILPFGEYIPLGGNIPFEHLHSLSRGLQLRQRLRDGRAIASLWQSESGSVDLLRRTRCPI